MKRKLKIAIISESVLFKEALKSMLDNLNKLYSEEIFSFIETYRDSSKLDVILKEIVKKDIDENSNNQVSHRTKDEIIRVIINKKYTENSLGREPYFAKPFRFIGLANVLFKIYTEFLPNTSGQFQWGHFSFYIDDKLLTYKGKNSVYLTDKESDIMLALMKNKHKGIKKEQILFDIWGFSKNMATHTFETHLYRLRKKIKNNLVCEDLIINKNRNYFLNTFYLGMIS